MARTPLFRTLSRLLLEGRAAARAGVPVLEYAERERERRAVSRRRFLAMSAGAASIPLLAACGEETPGPGPGDEKPTVAIVGGGIAGVHCAYRLKKLGVDATIYDAGKRLGGRMFTDRTTFPDGMHCELGGELIDTGHQTMRDLAVELGLELYDYNDDDPSLRTLVANIGGKDLTEQEILMGFAPIAAKIDTALATLTDQDDLFVYYNKHNGGEALDALSISAWLDSIGASGDIRTLLEVAYNIEYGLETNECNVLNLMLLISTDTMKLELFGDSDERFHTKLGNDSFPTLLAKSLTAEQIELETSLQAISEASDGRYVLDFQQGGAAKQVTADHVVLALPFSMLRKVDVKLELSAPKKSAIAEMGYGTNAKLMAGFSSRPWRENHTSNGETFTDLPYQATWETSRLQPGKSGIITNFTGGKLGVAIGNGTPEERLQDFLTQFDKVFTGAKAASNGKVARMHWPTSPLVLGSYSSYKVGQYTKFAGSEQERFKNVHFCGEHTSLDAQGYMEGGAATGAMAAAEIAADLKLTSRKAMSAQRSPLAWSPGDRILARANASLAYGGRLRSATRRALRKAG
jgi:monoamine oxidase